MNYWKIIGNGGVALCTTFISLLALGVETNQLGVSALAALLQGGLAACIEIECEAGIIPPTAAAKLVVL